MNIFPATEKGPLQLPGYLDPDDVTVIEVFWGASVFEPEKIYSLGELVKPSVETGYYYTCTRAGKSDITEPVWTQKKTISGEVSFKASPYDLFIGFSEEIATSSWTVTDGVTITSPQFTDEKTSIVVNAIPNGVVKFTLTNQVSKLTGEKLTRSFLINVNQQ